VVFAGGQRQRAEGDVDEADDRMPDVLGPVLVQAHVVRGPEVAELLAAGGELADQVAQVAVVGVAACFGAQQRDGGSGDLVPVGVEVPRDRGEEAEPGQAKLLTSEVDQAKSSFALDLAGPAGVLERGAAGTALNGNVALSYLLLRVAQPSPWA
jgi:hypothetical protein